MSKEKNKKKMPSIFKMATNFAKDLGKYIKEGAPNVSHKQYTERLEACNTCPNLRKALRLNKFLHKALDKGLWDPNKPSTANKLFKEIGSDITFPEFNPECDTCPKGQKIHGRGKEKNIKDTKGTKKKKDKLKGS